MPKIAPASTCIRNGNCPEHLHDAVPYNIATAPCSCKYLTCASQSLEPTKGWKTILPVRSAIEASASCAVRGSKIEFKSSPKSQNQQSHQCTDLKFDSFVDLARVVQCIQQLTSVRTFPIILPGTQRYICKLTAVNEQRSCGVGYAQTGHQK